MPRFPAIPRPGWFAILLLALSVQPFWIRSTSVGELPPLPLRAKIGQMLLVCFDGSSLPPSHALFRDIREHHLGGVMLRSSNPDNPAAGGNIIAPGQLQRLTRSLQTASPTPLLIAADQEGGQVCRLKPSAGFPPTTSAAELGRRNDLKDTYRQATVIARTLKQHGINFNFGPVVDLNRNPANPVIGALDRSFSAVPETVIAHARQVVAAHREHGILTCLKHFPGHGSSTSDSHRAFVDVSATWAETELRPFASLIEADLADSIMTAHVFNRRLDPELPATLSKPAITGLLRRNLRFDGVIISDDLRMDAISRFYPFAEALERTINAGVDILLICDTDAMTVRHTVALIHDMVERGRISRQRIEQSYRRISRLKSHLSPLVPSGSPPQTTPRPTKNPPSL